MKYGLQQFFVFSPKEWRGVLVFLLVVMALWFWPSTPEEMVLERTAPSAGVAAVNPVAGNVPLAVGALSSASPAAERFYFDPNVLDSVEWVRMGLSPLPLRRLLHYRQKGGRFRRAHDLYRIWDMDSAWVSSVLPWVKMPPAVAFPTWPRRSGAQQHFRRKGELEGNAWGPHNQKSTSWGKIDINAASLADWEALPGIGPVLAQRILRFRQSIGGFKQVGQVAQTYGLPTEVFQSILPRLRLDTIPPSQPHSVGPQPPAAAPTGSLAPLPLNQARVADLQALGISPALAQAIVTYRRLYGPYQGLSDLKKIPLVNDSVYQDLVRRLHW